MALLWHPPWIPIRSPKSLLAQRAGASLTACNPPPPKHITYTRYLWGGGRTSTLISVSIHRRGYACRFSLCKRGSEIMFEIGVPNCEKCKRILFKRGFNKFGEVSDHYTSFLNDISFWNLLFGTISFCRLATRISAVTTTAPKLLPNYRM